MQEEHAKLLGNIIVHIATAGNHSLLLPFKNNQCTCHGLMILLMTVQFDGSYLGLLNDSIL